MKIEKSCGVIVYKKFNKEIEFLVVKSKENGYWGFPKGHMEKGESEEETAIREVFEETGLSVKLLDDFRTRIEYTLSEDIFKEVIFFIGISLGNLVNIQHDEIQDFKWLKYDEMIDLTTFENYKQILKKVRNFIDNLTN